MNLCPDCANPLDEGGFTNCNREPVCERDRVAFDREVLRIKGALSLQALAGMEKNAMPGCFEPTRAAIVALAQLLMTSLRQNQELLAQVPKH